MVRKILYSLITKEEDATVLLAEINLNKEWTKDGMVSNVFHHPKSGTRHGEYGAPPLVRGTTH